ncbi:creatininase family protein [bacterium]|nr:creatininase family protein [bacterium]
MRKKVSGRQRLRSRYLRELTTPEVEAYFRGGGTTALIPAGAVEMHGPHQPIGTDTIIAKAFALRLAEAANGLVFPDIDYSWSGATEGFTGTVSIPPELLMELATWVIVKAHRMGFKRIVVVSIHGTNNAPLTIVVRRVYETHGIVAQYLAPWHGAVPAAQNLFAGKWATAMEASLTLAALEILGQGDLYTEKEMAYDDPAPPLLAAQMPFVGATGFFYTDLRHHGAPNKHTSKARGLQFFDIQVKASLPGIRSLDKYARQARREKNQGWFR